PTTSIREEPYQGDIMKKFGIRAVIGKGGMGAKTLAALEEHGGEISYVLTEAVVMTGDGELRTLTKEAFEFGYRKSVFANNH
ncbi:fumarate hydratase C-terminal domain-containing protein, partial [Bacillus cereus]